MSSDFRSTRSAVSLTSISKCYHLFDKPQDRLKQMLFRGYRKYYTEFWALRDVTFDIEKGACIGIIGRNGAGKSTLLQIITGVLAPTLGSVQIDGRVAALLELGTGFNPEFTGRENVFLNGSILGLTQAQLTEQYDEIVAFADIGEFVNQPVKTYSSGMMVRLAFAVAVHVDPEILIIDEALSVGDAKFQAKCFRKFQDFRDKGKTIIFVTHAVEQVIRHCDRTILLEDGRVYQEGPPKKVANTYLSLLFETKPLEKTAAETALSEDFAISKEEPSSTPVADELGRFIAIAAAEDGFPGRPGYNRSEYRWGSREAELVDYMLCSQDQWHINHFSSNDRITVYIKVRFNRDVARPIYGLTLKTPDGVTIYGSNSLDLSGGALFHPKQSSDIIVVSFSMEARLASGHYFLSLGIAEQMEDDVVALDRRYDVLEIYITNPSKIYGLADMQLDFAELAAENKAISTTQRNLGGG